MDLQRLRPRLRRHQGPNDRRGVRRPVATAGRIARQGVLALIRTDDADATLAGVVDAGGRVQAAMHDYPGGRRFTFADPSGNVLGVYEPSE